MPYFTKRLPVLKTNEKWREARREMWQETLLISGSNLTNTPACQWLVLRRQRRVPYKR